MYTDREPIKFSDFEHAVEAQSDSADIGEIEQIVPQKHGSVFEIEMLVHAQIPAEYPKFVQNLVVDRIAQQRILVRSRPLYNSLMKLIEYSPSFRESDLMMASQTQHVSIPEPFSPLMHHIPIIQKFLSDDQMTESQATSRHDVDSETELVGLALRKKHMRQLYDYLLPFYDRIATPFNAHLQGDSPRVSFLDLWFLFRPGDDVYFTASGIVRRAVVMDVRKFYKSTTKEAYGATSGVDYGVWRDPNEHAAWEIDMWFLFSDGVQIVRKGVQSKIWAYAGLREVKNLELCPADIWDKYDGGVRREKFLRRSQFTIDTLRQGHLLARYNGPTTFLRGKKYGIEEEKRHYVGQLVVDQKRGLAHMAEEVDENSQNFRMDRSGPLEDFSKKFASYDDIPLVLHNSSSAIAEQGADQFEIDVPDLEKDQPEASNLTEHQLLLLDPQLRAFLLKTKVWAVIQAGYLTGERPNRESFDQLVLGDGDRRTIEAICVRHSLNHETWAADFIQGKGKGQIVLLHGPPGVGKTYTVEAIAQWRNLPLIALTVADIGTLESSVEVQLAKWFALAEGWNGIVLVDEADVFLETREHRDLERNGLVSAFLRRLEYFEGLIALTTNRPGQIDDAFVSRVHVAIQYKPFGPTDRQEIWKGFFKKLVKDKKGKIRVAQEAKNWVLKNAEEGQTHLNGRDIRNALQTAITLAEYTHREAAAKDPDYDVSDEVIVEKSHFEDVLKMLDRFRTDLERIRGEDMSSSAKGRRDRNDYPVTEMPVERLSFKGK